MITTVCMNPCFDKTAKINKMDIGNVNRLYDTREDIGGKGINVATVLKRLGSEVNCVTCIGEQSERRFFELIDSKKMTVHYLLVPGEVRTNLKIIDMQTKITTEFNESGVSLDFEQKVHFKNLLKKHGEGSDFIVVSGKPPANCEPDIYNSFIGLLPDKKWVFDISDKPLFNIIEVEPFLVKPNLPELETLLNVKLNSLDAIVKSAQVLISKGVKNVIVSMGKEGAIYTNGYKSYFAKPIEVEVKSTVGAGDSLVAGVVRALDCGLDFKEAMRYGVAAGAANVMTEGTQLVDCTTFKSLLNKAEVHEI